MSRRKNLIPSVQLNVALPLDVHTRLSAELYSTVEERVPHGAYQKYLVEMLRERFLGKTLDLAPFIPGSPAGALIVTGTRSAIDNLKLLLEGEK